MFLWTSDLCKNTCNPLCHHIAVLFYCLCTQEQFLQLILLLLTEGGAPLFAHFVFCLCHPSAVAPYRACSDVPACLRWDTWPFDNYNGVKQYQLEGSDPKRIPRASRTTHQTHLLAYYDRWDHTYGSCLEVTLSFCLNSRTPSRFKRSSLSNTDYIQAVGSILLMFNRCCRQYRFTSFPSSHPTLCWF